MVLLAVACAMQAVPAMPGAVKIQQPDGSYVTIRLHGDEWCHFQTTDDGYSVVRDSRGFYVYAQLKDGRLEATAQVAHDVADRTAEELSFLSGVEKHQAPQMTAANARMKKAMQARQADALAAPNKTVKYENFKGLIILAQFTDKEFSRTDYKELITDMVNKEGYTGYTDENNRWQEYTGSVRDYFSDNSNGKFTPQFDVVGPYTIDYSQYDAKGTDNANALVTAAVNAADADVNYKDYDRDGDGFVDLVYVIFAGNGSNYGVDDRLFWPHRAAIYNPNYTSYYNYYIRKDNVVIFDYAASVEMYSYRYAGYWRHQLEGIGTICHEFSHVLGLPDFYDTDYTQSGGESDHPGAWSVMAGGNYLNAGRTPVGYSLYERSFVGFMDEPQKITAEGSYTLNPLATNFEGYRIDSPVNNEYFLLENRQTSAFKWDRYLPGSGMLVHRVDKTNSAVWSLESESANRVNANPKHNYYEVVRAGGGQGDGSALASDLFPGTYNVTALHNTTEPANLKTWSGKSTKWGLTNIKMANGVVTFDITNTLELKSLSLPTEMTIGVGVTRQLTPVVEPDFAEYVLAWWAPSPEIATVDSEGRVTGVSPGTCQILVSSSTGLLSNPCTVTVVEVPVYSVADFKNLDTDEEQLLRFDNAEVLYVKGTDSYIRDATGPIVLNNMSLGLKRNDIVNGTVFALPGYSNMMPVAVGSSSTAADALTITAGPTVQPREVRLSQLTPADYGDYVLVKGVKMVRESGVWAVEGDSRARVFNKLQVSGISLSDYDGKYFDIPAIYGTDVLSGAIINELYMLGTPVESEPAGISEIRMDVRKDGRFYNLQGQRVERPAHGLYIVNGKKVVVK